MIKYAVQCNKGHGFEAWFQNSGAFDTQVKRGLVTCPKCNSIRITKALMAPAVSAKTRRKGGDAGAAETAARRKTARAVAPAEPQRVATQHPTLTPEFVELLRKVRREVETKSEYVGPRFAEEARKIHYDEAPERGIYGEASLEDVRELHDEGIACLPLPELPEDQN